MSSSRGYFSSLEKDYESFYANRPFTFPNTSSFSLTSNGSCSFNATPNSIVALNGGHVDVVCSTVGLVAFTILALFGNVSTSMYLTIDQAPCYQWYFVASNAFEANGTDLTSGTVNLLNDSQWYARAWIMDLNTADGFELNNTAVEPSDTSKQLTRGFASTGLVPVIKGWENLCCWNLDTKYYSEKAFWNLEFDSWYQDQILTVTGNDATLVGCQVKSIRPRIYWKKFESSLMFKSAVSLGNVATNFSMFTENCFKSAMVALSSVYGSFNFAFGNSMASNMSIYTGSLNGILYSAAITTNGVLLLGSNGLEFFNNSISKTFTLTDVPEKLVFVDYCHSSNLPNWIYSVVTGFSNTTLHISLDGGYSFVKQVTLSQLTLETSNVGAFIRDVAIQPTFKNLAVLLRDAKGVDRIITYELEFGIVKNGYNFTTIALDAGILGSSPRIEAFPSGEVFAYGDNLFYSPNGGMSFFSLVVSKSSNEYFSQITNGMDGLFAVLTSSNRVFVGDADMNTLTELAAGIPENAAVQISFDFKNLFIYQPSASGVTRRAIPINNQIISPKSASVAGDTCPYFNFQTNFTRYYNLDIGESAKFYFSLLLNSERENSIAYAFTNLSLINHSDNLSFTGGPPSLAQAGYVEIYPGQSIETGIVEIHMEPKFLNLACSSMRASATINIGCPPSKTLHIIPPTQFVPYPPTTPRIDWSNSLGHHAAHTATGDDHHETPTVSTDCKNAPSMITLSPGSWVSNWSAGTIGQTEKIIPYDCLKYGNPIRLYYGDLFMPTFANFRGGEFEGYVLNDIAIWEDYGQSSFTFNLTQSDAGCVKVSQILTDFITNSTSDISEIWTPSNYQKCYVGSIQTIKSTNPYPLLNGTNRNSIKWTAGRNGHYLFSARVMDPEHSFCTLTANFAVEVYGAPLYVGYQAAIVIGMMVIILSILAISYHVQRYKLANKQKNE